MFHRERGRLVKQFISYFNQKASVSVFSCNNKDYSGREANFMKKLLTSKANKKKFYQDDKSSKNIQSVINDPSSQRRTPMRVSVLNKLFMTSITDILATGELSEDLIGRGMEVTNVSVNKDYQILKVYWIAKSKEDEIWLEENLPKLSHSLRHELSQLHLMGSVPRIQFFIDQRNSQLASLDSLISSCDKGDPESISDTETSPVDEIIPTMTNNVYGLQYDLIVSKLLKSINKAKAPHRKKVLDSNEQVPSQCVEDMSSKYSQKESIRKFLLQRRLNEEKYKKDLLENYDREVSENEYKDVRYREQF